MDVDSGFSRTTNTWNTTPTSIQDYKERVVYDPNGNITQYLRNGVSTTNLTMDSLSYFYNRDANGKLLNNQLNYIRDEIGGGTAHSSNYPNDIDNQSVNNYSYDSIGNLVKDNAEGITNITWNVYGKILEIQRTASGSNPTTDIQYSYDASGNRISKKVTDNSGNLTYTWYDRDAQGNVMSTYTSAGTGGTLTAYPVMLSEQHLYGSNRLGILIRSLDVKSTYTPGTIVTFQRGLKNYELSNHLGNVLVTISDKKTGISTNGTSAEVAAFVISIIDGGMTIFSPSTAEGLISKNFFESAVKPSKNGLSEVGRALQKHVGREGSSFSEIAFSAKTGNQQGVEVLDEILNSKNQLIEKGTNGTTTVNDLDTGRGVNIGRSGNFNGFRDIKEKK